MILLTVHYKLKEHFNIFFQVSAVQVAPNQLSIKSVSSKEPTDLKTDIHIKGVYCTKSFIAIWNSRKIAVYEISDVKSIIRSAGKRNTLIFIRISFILNLVFFMNYFYHYCLFVLWMLLFDWKIWLSLRSFGTSKSVRAFEKEFWKILNTLWIKSIKTIISFV